MIHFRQPPDSKLCGHACVAMVTGKTIGRAVVVIGHKRGTTTREIAAALQKMGAKPNGSRLKIFRGDLPEKAILKVVPKNRKGAAGTWHWVVKDGDAILDPAMTRPMAIDAYLKISRNRITSFLEV